MINENIGSTRTRLATSIETYGAELRRLRFSASVVRAHLKAIAELCQKLDETSVPIEELTPDLAASLVRHPGDRPGTYCYKAAIAARFVAYLAILGLTKSTPTPTGAPLAIEGLRREYEEYLRRHRGLTERTIYHSWRFADRFLTFRFGPDEVAWDKINAHDIISFLQTFRTGERPVRDKTCSTHLRTLFQFLFRTKRISTNLALSVPRVSQQHGTRLPRHITPTQVDAVVEAAKIGRHGLRNYAMVLLLARLGLRAQEVVAIQLDDIHWRRAELLIRGKGQRNDTMPLSPELGAALAEYIQHDRVSCSRALFVSSRAPNEPFRNGQVLNEVLKAAFATAGVPRPLPYVGSHILRHSLATNLVRQGASLPEVGDALRHRSRNSTLTYARLDIEGLRTIARPWPADGVSA